MHLRYLPYSSLFLLALIYCAAPAAVQWTIGIPPIADELSAALPADRELQQGYGELMQGDLAAAKLATERDAGNPNAWICYSYALQDEFILREVTTTTLRGQSRSQKLYELVAER